MNLESNTVVSLYVVKRPDGNYFGGFDSSQNKATLVSDPIHAKKFTNKYDIKLRPEEMLVELTVDLSKTSVGVSDPFRPHRRLRQTAK